METLRDLLVSWFRCHRCFDNYVSGTVFLTLDGAWDFDELAEYLESKGVRFEKDIS